MLHLFGVFASTESSDEESDEREHEEEKRSKTLLPQP